MNSYQSLSRESEIPENEQPLNYAEGKRSKTYATETSSPPIRVEPVEEQKSKSLSAMRQHASKQIDQLQKQADLLHYNHKSCFQKPIHNIYFHPLLAGD